MKNENSGTKLQGETKGIQSETALHTNGSGSKRDGRTSKDAQEKNQKALKVNQDHRSEDMTKHRRGTFP